MTVQQNVLRMTLAALALSVTGTVGWAQSGANSAVDANNMRADEIVRALANPTAGAEPKEVTRSFASRSLKKHDASEVNKDGLFINIEFAVNSAELDPSAREKLTELAKALKDPRLAAEAFGISGHTDASGGDAYNLELSRRRAESVRAFLETTFEVDGNRLFTNGQGERHLRNTQDPLASENRRVEIVNLAATQ